VGSLYSALFPADCRICQASLASVSRLPVCENCIRCIAPLPANVCRACGDLLPIGFASSENLCPECAFEAPGFERAVAYGAYTGGLRELIHLLKYEHIRPAADVLGRMLADAAKTLEVAGEVTVIPVPLHASKLKTRGFNQSELIARAAIALLQQAGEARYELEAVAMKRRRETPSQVGMTREQRAGNLRGAFAVTVPTMVRDKQVLLVDDVLTTGATVNECTRVLRRAGAKRVWVATVARAVRVADTYASAEHKLRAPQAMVAHA
jgi:ComF family protein